MGKSEFDVAFGKALRAYRGRAKISQSFVAGQTGHTHSIISKYESGDRTPSPGTVNDMANVYGTTAGDFFSLANDIKTILGDSSGEKNENK
jgi:transcriptional regulator with XRE-family HTH domain